VSELGLLRVEELSEAAEQSDGDIAVALHDTAVQWMERGSADEDGEEEEERERERVDRWLEHRMVEPRPREDAEIFFARDTDLTER
jgi:hypothetical protein